MMTHVSTSYHLGMGVVLVAVAPDTKERVTYATITRLTSKWEVLQLPGYQT